MNESSCSPEQLRISLAAAMSLGLKGGSFYRGATLNCLNLLLTYPGGCSANCSYCGLSRDAAGVYSGRSFIRVDWPEYPFDTIIGRARERGTGFERACLSMIMHPAAMEDAVYLVGRLVAELDLPVSVLVNPSAMTDGDLEAIRQAGADMVSVALDAATEDIFDANRGSGVNGPHRWARYWEMLEEAVIVFGSGKVGCHLIAGIGETEEEMMDTVTRLKRMGARSHLFSFYPEKGSRLEDFEPCPYDHFRRIQLARFLVDYDMVDGSKLEFDEAGRITGFALKGADLDQIVETGVPFMTSGCPGRTHLCACNRPYGDGPPSDIRSFPFNLDESDMVSVRKQLATYPEPAGCRSLDVEA